MGKNHSTTICMLCLSHPYIIIIRKLATNRLLKNLLHLPSENSQIMKFLFHTGNNLHYDFCIIEAMFEKAMFLGGLVTVSTNT